MRVDALSFFLALHLQASLCAHSQSARCSSPRTSSFSTPDSSRVPGRMFTVEEVVHAQTRGDTTAKTSRDRFPAVARRWSKWWERAGRARVVRLEAGCGRTTNRLATLEDGSKACVRYGVDQDQVLGETLCYYLATLLGIPNVPPLVLTKPDPFSQQWSSVRDHIEALNWSSDAVVSLTQWVPNATQVSIPVQFLRKMGTGVGNASLTLEKISLSDQRELMQWTDLILFDYLTANFDRMANHLFNLQWDRHAMDRPTNNLLRTTKGHLVFVDNEAGLVHGYRVLDRWEHLHQTLLNSTCMFREHTIQQLTELKHSRSAAQRLRQVYQTKETFALELGFLSKAQMTMLQNRVDALGLEETYDWLVGKSSLASFTAPLIELSSGFAMVVLSCCSCPIGEGNRSEKARHAGSKGTYTMYVELAGAVILGVVIAAVLLKKKQETLKTQDGWWGVGTPLESPEDDSIRPFKVETNQEEIEDLYRRIDQTRSFHSLEDSRFQYGFNSSYLQKGCFHIGGRDF
ncbi:hypothetical protein NFI96_002611 [Prochilodus magdalenae]|nr:hypothetical protein NFI96_002611 [Prochilodus magdalenae]